MDESFTVIQNKCINSSEKVLDNFSRYLKRNIIIVPNSIVLPEDSIHITKASKIDNDITNKNSTVVPEPNDASRHLQVTSDECEIPTTEFHNGDTLIESIKGFDRHCKNTQNSKYKKAVLSAKLTNLEIVAARQRKLLKKAEEFQELQRVYEVVEQQEGLLDKKINVLLELQNTLSHEEMFIEQVSAWYNL